MHAYISAHYEGTHFLDQFLDLALAAILDFAVFSQFAQG
jgi:hypothetical protein